MSVRLSSTVDSKYDCRARGREFKPKPGHIILMEIDHEIISTAILPLLLIPDQQLSVTKVDNYFVLYFRQYLVGKTLISLILNEFTVNFLNIRTPKKICRNHSKILTMWLYHRVMSPNDADGLANSVDLDQTAPVGAVWSGSALFAQTCLSENLGTLR